LIEKEPTTIKRKEKENLYTHEGDNKTTTKIKQHRRNHKATTAKSHPKTPNETSFVAGKGGRRFPQRVLQEGE